MFVYKYSGIAIDYTQNLSHGERDSQIVNLMPICIVL